MAEHKHGEMNTEDQEQTYAGFMRTTAWSCVVIVGVLLLLAIFRV